MTPLQLGALVSAIANGGTLYYLQHPTTPEEVAAFEPKVKRVIYLFMHGGPSHVDLFDPKPDLIKYAGEPLPASFGEVMTRRRVATNPLLGPIMTSAKVLTVISMAALGLGVDLRVVGRVGGRVTVAVVVSLLVLIAISVALIRLLRIA